MHCVMQLGLSAIGANYISFNQGTNGDPIKAIV